MSTLSMTRPKDLDAASMHGMPLWLWGLALVVAVLTLLANLPANWLATWVAQRSEGRIVLADASGTIWQGSAVPGFSADADAHADTYAAAKANAYSLPGRLAWRWQWPTGFTLPLELQYEGVLTQPLHLRLGWQGIAVDAGSAQLPLALSTLAGAPFNTLRLQGQARLEWSAFRAMSHPMRDMSASGTIHLDEVTSGINSAIASVRPLGAYRVDWQQTSTGLQWQVHTEHGPLQLQGQGSFQNGATRYTGMAGIVPDASPVVAERLQPLLNVLGHRADSQNQTNNQPNHAVNNAANNALNNQVNIQIGTP